MPKNLEGETIAAIATPLGAGGVGIVRISGSHSKKILHRIFKPAKKGIPESHKSTLGWVVDNSGDKMDKALALYMKAPNSYTGEDVVEISCHGSPALLKEVLSLSIYAGARMADKGEFTKRALLNGKVDLTQAEAVIDLMGAKTKEAVKAAARQLDGGISGEINSIKAKTLDLLTAIEASIDFPEEVGSVPAKEEAEAVKYILKQINSLIHTADHGRLYREGLCVAIVGKPNVGKSSLLNAILKEERAIVTSTPGTTRDTIEEGISIKGIPANLIDTAGMRMAKNKVEKMGVERAKRAIKQADLVVIAVDASQKLSREDKDIIEEAKAKPSIVALNKVDLREKINKKGLIKILGKTEKIVPTSAIYSKGIKKLEEAIYKKATEGAPASDRNIYINLRHKECLIRAKEALLKCSESVKNKMPGDFVSIDLKAAASALGEITGEEISEEVISSIFERFCVGK
ncbi:tRNA uridine-5-carboxymethylaminomethyl(34) synthesis GTPase MnmE [Candidatus Margulisiibacteriota bacterium]